jgi:hypothetical protein
MIELRDNLRVVANASTVPVLWMKTSKQMKMKWNESVDQAEREVIQDLVREECTEYLELSQSDLDDPGNLVNDCDDLEVSKA